MRCTEDIGKHFVEQCAISTVYPAEMYPVALGVHYCQIDVILYICPAIMPVPGK